MHLSCEDVISFLAAECALEGFPGRLLGPFVEVKLCHKCIKGSGNAFLGAVLGSMTHCDARRQGKPEHNGLVSGVRVECKLQQGSHREAGQHAGEE